MNTTTDTQTTDQTDTRKQPKTITNWHRKEQIYGWEIAFNETPARLERIKSDFDWLDDFNGEMFFQRGHEYYHASQFMRSLDPNSPWDGIYSDSNFSAIAIRYNTDEYGHHDDTYTIALLLA